VIGFKYIMWT